MSLGFYNSSGNPTGLTGIVGGGANTGNPMNGLLGGLFAEILAPPSGTNDELFQYRKVHLRNDHTSATYTGVKVWLDSMDHMDQLFIGLEASTNDSVTHPTGNIPASVTFSQPITYTGGLDLGTLTAGSASGIWVRQGLSGIHEADPYVTFRLGAGGYEK